MFFTTYQFILIFLPLALLGFYALRRWAPPPMPTYWLLAASALFYWSLERTHLGTLLASIVINYFLGRLLFQLKSKRSPLARSVFVASVGFNAFVLVLFKYILPAVGVDVPVPLGLSFFTLLQIGYHIAIYAEKAEPLRLPGFALFVGYFPYVVAGPLVHRKDFPFDRPETSKPFDAALFLSGLALFTFGLFKKLLLADSVVVDVNAAFAATSGGAMLGTAEAWLVAVSYMLQLYFDFSAYSDMAAGISAMFGFRLPRNFHSPLKARSISEYWRRWHMTVTRFFTNSIYLLLTINLTRSANRLGAGSRLRFALTVFMPLLCAFTLIGVWHGSGANFLLFGLLMATALSVNQLWTRQKRPPLVWPLGWGLTMLVVLAGMVLDKTAGITEARSMFASMLGLGADGRAVLPDYSVAVKTAVLAAIALLMPNTHQILSHYQPVLPDAWDDKAGVPRLMAWKIGTVGMLTVSVALTAALVVIPRAADFIYYRF
jgi:alginate O-acetyltransferase complex protein AlgI